jgi:hypothetical protein
MTGPIGDGHPPESADERDDPDDHDREQWLRENVPPHHI